MHDVQTKSITHALHIFIFKIIELGLSAQAADRKYYTCAADRDFIRSSRSEYVISHPDTCGTAHYVLRTYTPAAKQISHAAIAQSVARKTHNPKVVNCRTAEPLNR